MGFRCGKHSKGYGPGLETLMAPPLHRGPRALKGTRLLRISGKGGVHWVGTVVSTVSASGRRASSRHMGLDERYYKLRALNRYHASKSWSRRRRRRSPLWVNSWRSRCVPKTSPPQAEDGNGVCQCRPGATRILFREGGREGMQPTL